MSDVLDGEEWADRFTLKIAQCVRCSHWHKGETTCDAFPDEIPSAIFIHGEKHTESFSGDHGIQFELRTEKHLAGQHDQSSHGRGGAGSGVVGQGKELSPETTNRIAKTIADALHFPKDKITTEHIDEDIIVGGKSFKLAGEYNSTTDTVRIKEQGWNNSDDVVRIVSHEVQHHRWHTTMKALTKEMNIIDGEGSSKILKPDGTVRDDFQRRFPVYHKLNKSWTDRDPAQMEKDDGVSSYSKAYWDKFNEVRSMTGNSSSAYFQEAVNETLSEIAAIKSQTGIIEGGKSLRDLYKAMDAAYFEVRSDQYRWKAAGVSEMEDGEQIVMYWDKAFNPVDLENAHFVTIAESGSWMIAEIPVEENADG